MEKIINFCGKFAFMSLMMFAALAALSLWAALITVTVLMLKYLL